MEQAPNQPIYWDKHRIPVNLTLLFALGVAAFGVYEFLGDGNPILIFAGLGVAAYTWFTNPRQYLIYPDALYVMYGKPRVKMIHFSDVSRLEMRVLATPDRLRVHPKSGRRVVLMARDPEAFHEQLEKALNAYKRLNPDEFYDDEPIAGTQVVEGSISQTLPETSLDTPTETPPETPPAAKDPPPARDNRDNQAPY
jgi:hypothetical protein